MRVTDEHVRRFTGLVPLSVSADRIGHAALRWAAIAATLAAEGRDDSRDGAGLLVEVYPAAALRVWNLPFRGYKGTTNRAARDVLVDGLLERAPWLDLHDEQLLCRESDDALDAVLCALIARAVACGAAAGPPDQHRERAADEGWIHVPRVSLSDLGAVG